MSLSAAVYVSGVYMSSGRCVAAPTAWIASPLTMRVNDSLSACECITSLYIIEERQEHTEAKSSKGIITTLLGVVFLMCTNFPHTNYLPFFAVSAKHTQSPTCKYTATHCRRDEVGILRQICISLYLFIPHTVLWMICILK